MSISPIAQVFENIPRAACSSSHSQAPKTALFDVVYLDISIRNFFKTDPRGFNSGHHRLIFTFLDANRWYESFYSLSLVDASDFPSG